MRTPLSGNGIARLVGFLVCVELASGVLQGYYTPLYTDIARHLSIHDADVNWFEAAQLVVSALLVPLLARLGDIVGHRTVLLWSTAATAAASWCVAIAPSFGTFLVAWALQGFYVVWLPLEIAIIHGRTKGDARRTRVGAGVLVAALEVGVILGAGVAGALAGGPPMTVILAMPAVAVSLSFVAVWFGVGASEQRGGGTVDWVGFVHLTGALALMMAGLILLRLQGTGSVWPWLVILGGAALTGPFVRHELRVAEPLVDMRVLGQREQWPLQLTAGLFGASVLGAQIPLSTYARTDPAETGYGLDASAGMVSVLVAAYVLAMALGAGLLPWAAARLGPRITLVGGCGLVGLGYLLFLPWHDHLANLLANMLLVGVGSGVLVAALPAAAAAAAPITRTGFATGMTNTTKTIGGAVASSVFAIALASTGSLDEPSDHAPLHGYYVVWSVCAATALAAGITLLLSRTRTPAVPLVE
ncbi:MFS transporter [Luteipulveratus mongoliensis]|uniref:Transporter n=1 Tax=Luteipulveratus mongoliensis TaxID=571913 RepID=A0A0K1JDL8_9MICO|nr:MFS transporter [Luteipulveratus mongoliensis]AKU14802.1 transporter [Luteipulveratus mongoliensis]